MNKKKYFIIPIISLCSLSFSQNTPPVAVSEVGKAFTGIETNISLNATDQDGDNLSYTILTDPINGTATITNGILSYTSNLGFSGTDEITFNVNDGFDDSNEAQLQIEVVEKSNNLNWATYFSTTQLIASKQDSFGNTFAVGRFWDYSNFKDNTLLDAIYPQGSKDGYIAKYNSLGELEWVSTFGGIYDDKATDIAVGNDGNVVVTGTIRGEALFSDGTTLNSNSQENVMFVAKLDSSNGDILWNNHVTSTYTESMSSKYLAIDSLNNIILTAEDDCNCYNRTNVLFFKLNYSNGNTLVSDKVLESGSNITEFTYGIEDLELDSDNNIIITGAFDGSIDIDLNLDTQNILGDGESSNDELYFAKYDSDFNFIWGITITSPYNSASGFDLAFDSINNLIFLSAYIASPANINPLGTPVNISNSGFFVAAYDTNGILQFHHNFSNNNGGGGANNIVLEVNDDKLLLFGNAYGELDFDITDDNFITNLSNNWGTFASIYELNNGPTLVGQYFFGANETESGYKGEISLIGDNLLIASSDNRDIELFDFEYNSLVSLTNIPYENDNAQTFYSSLVSFNLLNSSLSLLETNNINYSIFPNPTSKYLNILSDTVINTVQIFDLKGKKVYEKKYNSNRIRVDSSNLNKGLYLILVDNEKLFKLIKD